MSNEAEASTDYTLLVPSRPPSTRFQVLACCVCVFLAQYTQSSPLIAPFLAISSPGLLVGTDAVGVIFAAYPLATAIATPLPSLVMEQLGVHATVLILSLIHI